MVQCDYCGETINELPWVCKRCGKTFCGKHRLPEDHDCPGIKQKNFFEPLTKKPKPKYKKTKSKFYKENYEMYIPGKKKHHSQHFSRKHFNLKNFFNKYIYFRIQDDIKPYLMQFLFIFLVGIVLNYVYYQTFSLTYLFIGGFSEWFKVFMSTINYGFGNNYNLFYLVINGIYYAYFYYRFVLVIYHTLINLDKRDTWIMLCWFVLIIWVLIYFLPQIV